MSRIAFGDHAHIELEEEDLVVFSSKVIPGNERAIDRVQNQLALIGVQVVTEKEHMVHTSGHPSRGELAEMYSWTRPTLVVPVHGERRHLEEHAEFALNNGVKRSIVVKNGDVLRLYPGPQEIIDCVPAGRLVLDGRKLVAEDSGNVQMRRRLGLNGFIAVTIVLSDAGLSEVAPRVLIRGVPGSEGDSLGANVIYEIQKELPAIPRAKRADDSVIDNTVRRIVRRLLKPLTYGRPPIEVDIIRLTENIAKKSQNSLPSMEHV